VGGEGEDRREDRDLVGRWRLTSWRGDRMESMVIVCFPRVVYRTYNRIGYEHIVVIARLYACMSLLRDV